MLTKAEEAREANSHAQVKDELQLEMHNYEIEKRTKNANLTLIEHLKNAGFIKGVDDYYVVQVDKVGNPALGKGTDRTTGDVYVIEKENSTTGNITKLATVQESDVKQITKVADESMESEDWVLRYYKTSSDVKTLLNLTSTVSLEDDDRGNPTVPTVKTVADLKVGDYVDYVVNGQTYKSIVLYDKDYTTEDGTSYGVQIVTENCVEDNVSLTGFNGAFDTLNSKAQYYKNNSICTLARLVGSVPSDGTLACFGYEEPYSVFDDPYDPEIDMNPDLEELENLKVLNSDNNFWLGWKWYAHADTNSEPDLLEVISNGYLICAGLVDFPGFSDGDYSGADSTASSSLRLCFQLKEETEITGGTGKVENPYQLQMKQ